MKNGLVFSRFMMLRWGMAAFKLAVNVLLTSNIQFFYANDNHYHLHLHFKLEINFRE